MESFFLDLKEMSQQLKNLSQQLEESKQLNVQYREEIEEINSNRTSKFFHWLLRQYLRSYKGKSQIWDIHPQFWHFC